MGGVTVKRLHPKITDVAMGVMFTGVAFVIGSEYHPHGWGNDPLAYFLTLLIFLPLVARRLLPATTSLISSLALAAYMAAGYDQLGLNFWGPLLALYSVASIRPPQVTAVCWAVCVPILFWASRLVPNMSVVGGLLEAVLFPTMAWMFGTVGLQLAERNRQLDRLTLQLRAEQQERAAHAVANERVRIARELHDVVAHHISVISVQAGLGGYVFDADPPTARAALDTIARTSREALHELRRLLVLLRVDTEAPGYDNGSHDPAPGLADLPELVERMRGTGLRVDLSVIGFEEMTTLAPGLQLCAYRVTQEALTNALKHAWSGRTGVFAHHTLRWLIIRVISDGETPDNMDTTTDSGGAGHGLRTMNERAVLYGGSLRAGPKPTGGYEVELSLPLPAPDEDRRGT